MTYSTQIAEQLRIREVLPRDGFQDHSSFVPTSLKIEIIRALHDAGCRWIEVTSFVHPEQVPQFIDAQEVAAGVRGLPDLLMSSFVPNLRGLRRAVAAEIDEISVAVASTDRLAQANFRRSRDEVITEALKVADEAAQAAKLVSVTIGGAFGCPFEGHVAPEFVMQIAHQLVAGGVDTILLADTIGSGSPAEVGTLVGRAVEELPGIDIGVHIHGSRGLESVRAAVAAGASIVDASMAGFGGCPFVPDAPGNVDTATVTREFSTLRGWVGPQISRLDACVADIRTRLGALSA